MFNQSSTKYLTKYLSFLLLQYHIFIKRKQNQRMDLQTSRDKNSIDNSQLTNTQEAEVKGFRIKCTEFNQAVYLCTNENCKEKSAFTCVNMDCLCQFGHELCSKVKFKNIIQVIERKKLQTSDIKEFINLSFDKMIDQLSELKQKLLDEVESKLKFTYQSQIQKKFLKVIYGQQQKPIQFNSKDSNLLWKVATNKEVVIKNLFSDSKELVNKFLNKLQNQTKQNITTLNSQMNQIVNKELEKQSRRVSKLKKSLQLPKLQLTAHEQTLIPIMVKQSSIMSTRQYAKRLIMFFPKPINKISLILKNNNKVSINQFYNICRSVSNTIILCKTKEDKIVGGYTPLKYYKQNLKWGVNTAIEDLSEESFMFSLSNNDKFYLQDKYHAIQLGNDNAICFGSNQICIGGHSFVPSHQICTLNFNGSYVNQKYIKKDKQTYLRFNGKESSSCEISYFQVWKVQMQE